MRYSTLYSFLSEAGTVVAKGPLCLIMAEDDVEVESTLRHHQKLGFRDVVLLAPEGIDLPDDLEQEIHVVTHDVFAEAALSAAVNRFSAAFPGSWIYYCYNAEYLYFPFCETRSIREMITFHVEERREAMLGYVIDLYASDLGRHPNAVALDSAQLDRSGYYALERQDPAKNWAAKDRQLDFYGGLRWRFEEHVPWARRKIDRVALFKARSNLKLAPDFTFNDEEYNTYACPWHHSMTFAVCSFRTAKALRANPGSRFEVQNFFWYNSVPFDWHSQQLMDLGLMEPGQWF